MLLNAQTDVTISKKDFKNDKNGFETAWKHVETGDGYFKDKGIWYGSAFDEYLKASLYNSANPELNYKAGVAALYSDNKEEAIRFFQKVLEEKPDLAPDVLFYTGRALQYAGKYSEAVEKLNGYLNAPGKKPEENVTAAKKFLEECGAALDLVKDTLRVKILNIPKSSVWTDSQCFLLPGGR
jgi:tetratricopeptide (TPR) repeat protein